MLIFSAVITLIITGIAGYLGKLKVKTSKDFIVGGSKFGVIGVTSMLMGSIIGGASTVGTAQMAYNRGIGAMWFIFGVSLASIILGLIYSKQINKKSSETLPQIIGNTYGEKARTTSSILLSMGMFIHVNGQIIACIALFTALFGISVTKTAVIVVCLLVIYVVFGGFWGSTMVGAIKTILLYGTSLICGYIIIVKLNGISEISTFFPKNPWFNLFSGGISEDLAAGFATVVGILSTQTYFQAIMAGKNSKTSRRSAFLVAFMVLPVGIVCTFIGMYMRVHHPNIAPREAFPLFLVNYLNPVIGGISIATVLISSIATGAGLTLGIATMFVRDVYKQIINTKANDKKQLFILRATIIFIGFITLIVVINNKGTMILEWGFLSMVFRATPVFIPVTAAMFFKSKIKPEAGIYSIIAAPLASIIWILMGFEKVSSIYIGLIVGTVIIIYMSKSKGRKYL
ncbi:sodium:solute symporter family protein [Clostridium aestuarii]|uniref:Sodium:solute symporter family protein n=1 Tax=Clostridium aestuarii TaxID=338193 RepID=A0ABT4D2T7_9CLOT|nr:sodium:solute symporter family protein [Clostridium aestuarii]